MDAYDNVPATSTRRGVTVADQLAYNWLLLDAAHGLGLSVGLKNALALLPLRFANGQAVTEAYDWFINEQCWQYDECGEYSKYITRCVWGTGGAMGLRRLHFNDGIVVSWRPVSWRPGGVLLALLGRGSGGRSGYRTCGVCPTPQAIKAGTCTCDLLRVPCPGLAFAACCPTVRATAYRVAQLAPSHNNRHPRHDACAQAWRRRSVWRGVLRLGQLRRQQPAAPVRVPAGQRLQEPRRRVGPRRHPQLADQGHVPHQGALPLVLGHNRRHCRRHIATACNIGVSLIQARHALTTPCFGSLVTVHPPPRTQVGLDCRTFCSPAPGSNCTAPANGSPSTCVQNTPANLCPSYFTV